MLCRRAGSDYLQSPVAGLRPRRRQPDRPLQHAGARPSSTRAYPGELPRTAEEVSEEASPVEILAPDAAVLTTPNRITKADFDNWVEQRGSKFWSSWDSRYTPIISTWDRGQPPQRRLAARATARERLPHTRFIASCHGVQGVRSWLICWRSTSIPNQQSIVRVPSPSPVHGPPDPIQDLRYPGGNSSWTVG